LGGSAAFNLLRRKAPLAALAKFGDSAARRHYCACMGVVIVSEGAQEFWLGARGGGEKVSMVMVSIGSLG